jgi:hypothetical protein
MIKMENQMKRITLFFAVAMILLLTGLMPALAVMPNVVVSGFNVNEGKAAVGQDFVLSLTLANTEPTACAQGISTTVQAGFPFILKGITTRVAGDMCAGTTKGSSLVVDFPMRIDPTAKGGSYQLTITNNFETPTLNQFSTTNVINIFVEGTPEINAYIINSNPIDVYPGDTATLTVVVENDGSFQAQSVTASMSASSPIDVSPANSFSSFGLLDAKQSKTATFTVEVPKNAAAEDYPLSLEVQYLDENLESQTKVLSLALHVKPIAMFATADDGSDTLYPNQNSRTVRLLLKNTGTDPAYKIKAKILPQYPFSTDGSVRYVDVLEPGKTVPVQFTVDIDKDAKPGTYELDALMDFEDGQGKSLQDTAEVSLAVVSEGFFRSVFVDYWFLWLAIIVIAFIIIRRRRKKAAMKKKA